MSDLLSDEVEARAWITATCMHSLSHSEIIARVVEVEKFLSAMDDRTREAWCLLETMKVSIENNGYRLTRDQFARVEKLLARGRETPYCAELQRRCIDRDHLLVNYLSQYARPNSGELI